MFCIVAFIILAIMGVFSATSRGLAREAFSCVLRRVALRPCTTGFDDKIKAKILGTVINRSERAARLLNRNFELISWVFFLLMVVSTAFAGRGLYLFYVTGSCNGANQSSFCILDPDGEHNKISTASGTCPLKAPSLENLTLANVDLATFPTIAGKGKGRIVMIGCYGCDYSRQVYPLLRKLAARSGATFVFMDYPVKVASDLTARLGYCVQQRDQEKFWRLNDLLFATRKENLDDKELARKTVAGLGLNATAIDQCLAARQTSELVKSQLEKVTSTNFYGTPTVFINDQPFVGPKPYRVYAIALQGLFYWSK